VRQLVGKSVVIHAADGGSERIACATIEAGVPDASTFAGTVKLAGVVYSSGHEVSSEDFGGDLNQGIAVVMSDYSHNFLIFNWKDIGACLDMEMCGVQPLSVAAGSGKGASGASDYVGQKKPISGGTIAAGLALVVMVGVAATRWKATGGSDKGSESIYADEPDLSPA
jgi:hypothetical protein